MLDRHTPENIRRTRPVTHRARPAPGKRAPIEPSGREIAIAGGAFLAAVVAGRLAARRTSRPARLASAGAALLATSVLADSTIEHSTGNYFRPEMYVPPAQAAAAIAAAAASGAPRPGLRQAVFGGAALAGIAGTAFHVWNLYDRPDRMSWNALFYGAPLGAPGALGLAGVLGLAAVAAEKRPSRREARRTGRALAALTSGAIFGLSAEITLLHFRGAFQNRAMLVPVLALPAAGASLAAVAARPTRGRVALARRLLGLTALMGAAGTAFHAYGVQRSMGGFRNWTQNLFQGPPVAAPPSLAGIALGGFAALDLIDRAHRSPEGH